MEFFNLETSLESSGVEFSKDFIIISNEYLANVSENVFTEGSEEGILNKLSELFIKVYETIKKFFKELILKINIKIQQIQVNKKLEEFKILMAKNRAKIVNKKVNHYDVTRYKEYYTQFINQYTGELLRGLNKDFNTAEEFERWQSDMLHGLQEFDYKLSDEEQWKLTMGVNSSVALSETELRNRENNINMVREQGLACIHQIEICSKNLMRGSKVNYEKNTDKFIVTKKKQSLISRVVNSLLNGIQRAAHWISKHFLLSLTILFGIFLIVV